VPDWSTLTTLPYAPGHAHVLGDMVKRKPWALCPHSFVKRILKEAEQEVSSHGRFENEFTCCALLPMEHPR